MREPVLRERLDVSIGLPEPGALVFAQSADGKYYVAEVISSSDDAVRVRYLKGSEHTVALDQVRAAAFLPGERVVVNWPWWGPWTCTVISFDAAEQKVKLTDGWGDTKAFPIAEVWQRDRRDWSEKLRVSTTWLGVGTALGALLGSALTWLALRGF